MRQPVRPSRRPAPSTARAAPPSTAPPRRPAAPGAPATVAATATAGPRQRQGSARSRRFPRRSTAGGAAPRTRCAPCPACPSPPSPAAPTCLNSSSGRRPGCRGAARAAARRGARPGRLLSRCGGGRPSHREPSQAEALRAGVPCLMQGALELVLPHVPLVHSRLIPAEPPCRRATRVGSRPRAAWPAPPLPPLSPTFPAPSKMPSRARGSPRAASCAPQRCWSAACLARRSEA